MLSFPEKFEQMSPRRRKFILFSSGLFFSFLLSLLIFGFLGGSILEWHLSDYWINKDYPKNVSKKVAVVGIDEDLFEKYKFNWPLDKEVYGELIYFLQEMGASVIAFDIEFTHNIDKCGKNDSIFVGMLQNSKDVILGYGMLVEPKGKKGLSVGTKIDDRFSVDDGVIPGYSVHGAILPYKDLYQSAPSLGFLNRAQPMIDGVDRKMPLLLEQDSKLFPSLAITAVSEVNGYKTVHFDSLNNRVTGDNNSWPTDNNANIIVNFSDSIPYFPLSELLLSFEQYLKGEPQKIGKKELDGRVIFVGVTAPSLGDFGITPVSKRREMGRTPNVFMHAQSAETILENRVIKGYGLWGAVLFSMVSLIILFFFFMLTDKKVLYIVIPTLFVGQYYLGYNLYNSLHYIPVVQGIFSSLIFSVLGILIDYFEDNHEYRFLSSFFKTYLSPEYIEMMAKEQSKPKLGGEATDGTAFFTDIEKFSTFSEMFTPEELIMVLNDYFSKMTNILLDNNGTLDKYIGDAIVAFFGAPRHSKNHPFEACMTAYQMQKALGELREEWSKTPEFQGKVDNIRMRIGINTGTFITGNIGCDLRMNYTMIGDAVNLSARLESGAKQYGVYTLVGEDTYTATKDQFLFRHIDIIIVMGRSHPVSVYELIGLKEDSTDSLDNLIETYEKGLSLYFNGDFAGAELIFAKSSEYEFGPKSNTNPSLAMIDRCKILSKTPPADWKGVFSMTHK